MGDEKKGFASMFEKLQGAASAVKDKVDESGMTDKIKDTAGSVKEKVEKADLQGKFKDTVDAVKTKAVEVKLPGKKTPDEGDEERGAKDLPDKADRIKVISTKSALKIIYYLMAVNGEICSEEEEKFDYIGNELDPAFNDDRKLLIDECKEQMTNLIDPEDSYDVIEEGVSDAIANTVVSADSFITPKILVWDLLSIAYSDNNYDDMERKLVKSVVRQLGVDKTEFLELESSYLTMMDIEKEIEWIKTTDRPYKQIEAMVNELTDRKSVIMESVKDLISL